MAKVDIKNIEPDYIHSSNTVFSFMKKADYLEKTLSKKSLFPRYCEENIEYLNLKNEGKPIKTIMVLQKCFCDIPLHCLTAHFPLSITTDISTLDETQIKELNEGNTHTDFYGEFGIAFSKNWAKEHNLQPVQYINPKSSFAEQFRNTFSYALVQDEIDDLIVSDITSRLCYFKPLFGEMTRNTPDVSISYLKNFHDECEWRYVPKSDDLTKYRISSVIFDDETKKLSGQISDRLSDDKYKELWLDFDYSDIRYLIVPDNGARNSLIDYILKLQIGTSDELLEKHILISKILVLEDIKRDF